MNFENIGDSPPPPYGGSGGAAGTSAGDGLVRQPSVYSLTFEEFQNGLRKDLGSMNMDELLKNIWTAEETQAQATTTAMAAAVEGGGVQMGSLQRQGSLTLPRTLSQKTVDEVWRDLFKESEGIKGGSGGGTDGTSGLNVPERQQTLGEMTLEEFLVKAGVVREDAQSAGRPENAGIFGDLLRSNNSGGLSLDFGQPGRTKGDMVNPVMNSTNALPIANRPPHLSVNAQQLPNQRQLFPKHPSVVYAPVRLGSQGPRSGIVDPTVKGLVQSVGYESGGMGIIRLGGGGATNAATSPGNSQSSDGLHRSSETYSLSPASFAFDGGRRGSRGDGIVDKVVERRQRRMIKNRESAARSRARKQENTVKLEEEVAKLRKQNEELKKKQEEIVDIQKNQMLKAMIQQKFAKKRRLSLRRTLTGPW